MWDGSLGKVRQRVKCFVNKNWLFHTHEVPIKKQVPIHVYVLQVLLVSSCLEQEAGLKKNPVLQEVNLHRGRKRGIPSVNKYFDCTTWSLSIINPKNQTCVCSYCTLFLHHCLGRHRASKIKHHLLLARQIFAEGCIMATYFWYVATATFSVLFLYICS